MTCTCGRKDCLVCGSKMTRPPQLEEESKGLDALVTPCPNCNGDGFTAEHDTHPHIDGCDGACPVKVQCERCYARGYFVDKTALTEWLSNKEREARSETVAKYEALLDNPENNYNSISDTVIILIDGAKMREFKQG